MGLEQSMGIQLTHEIAPGMGLNHEIEREKGKEVGMSLIHDRQLVMKLWLHNLFN